MSISNMITVYISTQQFLQRDVESDIDTGRLLVFICMWNKRVFMSYVGRKQKFFFFISFFLSCSSMVRKLQMLFLEDDIFGFIWLIFEASCGLFWQECIDVKTLDLRPRVWGSILSIVCKLQSIFLEDQIFGFIFGR